MFTPDVSQTVRRAFLAEGLFHAVTIPLITHPLQYLSYFVLEPNDITNITVFFARVFAGLIIFGMTPILLYGVPNTGSAIASRRATYIMLAGTEVYLIPFLLVELSRWGQAARGASLTVEATAGLLSLLVVPFSFRVYSLFFRPQMMGDHRLVDKKR